MIQTLNPFKFKLGNIKDAYRIHPQTDSEPQPRKSQGGEIKPKDVPKQSKEDIQRKIQKALLMKEHSGKN